MTKLAQQRICAAISKQNSNDYTMVSVGDAQIQQFEYNQRCSLI
jgi:hypothetical protein